MVTDDFWRALDTCIIKLRAKEVISRDAALAAVSEVMAEMEIEPDKWVLEGKELGKLHIVRFTGTDGIGEQRARKFMQLQKTAKGWRRLVAADDDECEVEVFVDGDKNRSMVRCEIITRRLGGIVAGRLPDKKIVAKRQEGKVFIEWIPLVRVLVVSEDVFTVEWNRKAVDDAGLRVEQRNAIDAEIQAACVAGGDVQWG